MTQPLIEVHAAALAAAQSSLDMSVYAGEKDDFEFSLYESGPNHDGSAYVLAECQDSGKIYRITMFAVEEA